MKTDQVKADGTIYWYETSDDWGTFLSPGYKRFACRRVDDQRYYVTGSSYSSHREGIAHPNGKYIRVQPLNSDLIASGGVRHVLARYVRDEYTAVKERYERQQGADRRAELERQTQADAAQDRAAEYRDRLGDLRIDGITVRATTGRGYGEGAPRVIVDFGSPYGDPEHTLADLLDRLERGKRAEARLAELAEARIFAEQVGP